MFLVFFFKLKDFFGVMRCERKALKVLGKTNNYVTG